MSAAGLLWGAAGCCVLSVGLWERPPGAVAQRCSLSRFISPEELLTYYAPGPSRCSLCQSAALAALNSCQSVTFAWGCCTRQFPLTSCRCSACNGSSTCCCHACSPSSGRCYWGAVLHCPAKTIAPLSRVCRHGLPVSCPWGLCVAAALNAAAAAPPPPDCTHRLRGFCNT